jgi:hypothetical protein
MADQVNSIIPENIPSSRPATEPVVVPAPEVTSSKEPSNLESNTTTPETVTTPTTTVNPISEVDNTLSADAANALLKEVVNAPGQIDVAVGHEAKAAGDLEAKLLGQISSR